MGTGVSVGGSILVGVGDGVRVGASRVLGEHAVSSRIKTRTINSVRFLFTIPPLVGR
jgi:hypothetical protein